MKKIQMRHRILNEISSTGRFSEFTGVWILSIIPCIITFFCGAYCFPSVSASSSLSNDDYFEIRWISSGGGWRSMGANMAYTNIFEQLGLISSVHCNFTSITGTSGGAWFSTQLFFSKPFFDVVVKPKNGPEIYNFIFKFVQSLIRKYESNSGKIDVQPTICNILSTIDAGDNDQLVLFTKLCRLASVNGDYAAFITELLRQATTDYGDPDFVDRIMNIQNRIDAFEGTEHQVLIGLSPTSKLKNNPTTRITYVAANQSDSVFALSIPYLHVVTNQKDPFFFIGTEPANLPLLTKSIVLPFTRNRDPFELWEDYLLRPGINGTVFVTIPRLRSVRTVAKLLQEPFMGSNGTTTAQINAATSSFAALLSGLSPSILMQYLSALRVQNGYTQSLRRATRYYLSSSSIMNEMSVCTQWPNRCTQSDSRFVDGAVVEGVGIAMNIGRYHSKSEYNISRPLKIIVTYNSAIGDGVDKVTTYFNNSSNDGIEPGDFFWVKREDNVSNYFRAPFRSAQVFDTYLDYQTIANITGRQYVVNGTNITYMMIETRTLRNPAFRVKEGQKVQLLVLQLNSGIELFPLLLEDIQSMQVPLAQLALDISESTDLVQICKEFLEWKI